LQGYVQALVHHIPPASAQGDGPEQRAAGLGSWRKPSWRGGGAQQNRPPGLWGLLAVPAALAAPDGVRAGGADLVCSPSPIDGEQSQKGRVGQTLGPV
jgi:hypothetical protein